MKKKKRSPAIKYLQISDIDQLITISGMVIRTTNILPEMSEAFFKCIVCSFTTKVVIDRGRIAEPTLCSNCKTSFSFSIIHNMSTFIDKQMIKLQESPGKFKSPEIDIFNKIRISLTDSN